MILVTCMVLDDPIRCWNRRFPENVWFPTTRFWINTRFPENVWFHGYLVSEILADDFGFSVSSYKLRRSPRMVCPRILFLRLVFARNGFPDVVRPRWLQILKVFDFSMAFDFQISIFNSEARANNAHIWLKCEFFFLPLSSAEYLEW
jgi:hypothetical protein